MSKFQVVIICEVETEKKEDAVSLAQQVCDEANDLSGRCQQYQLTAGGACYCFVKENE